MNAEPVGIRVRMYNVGFGDCFLITFEYSKPLADGRDLRQILIDFGTTRKGVGGPSQEKVARLIKQHCRGKLDVLVITHRHKDHLGGFGVDSAAILTGLKPALVVRPWTEEPDVQGNMGTVNSLSLRFKAHLAAEQLSAEALAKTIAAATLTRPDNQARADLFAAASEELKNEEAIQCLDSLAYGERGRYVHYGSDLQPDFVRLIPGVQVKVLGPPTPEQHKAVTRQRSEDKDQFWLGLRNLTGTSTNGLEQLLGGPVDATEPAIPGPRQWIIDRMQRQHVALAIELVRWLDDALNNTSVILLFGARGKRLLFPGDAQIENWEYALGFAANRKELELADLYKVGHHGSRNATPKKALFELWTSPTTRDRQMTGLMSTRRDVHGKTDVTKVPSLKLIKALRDRPMMLLSTDDPEGLEFLEVECDLNKEGSTFRRVG